MGSWLRSHPQAPLRVEGPGRCGDRFVPKAARRSPGQSAGFVLSPTRSWSILLRGEATPSRRIGANRLELPRALRVGTSGLIATPRRLR